MNLAPVRAKANAGYRCQECGSTELIQAHHEIPGDDSSLIVLCAECHSKRHPNVPKTLFFSTNNQPYWQNKSASSLAKDLGVHSRTVIRVAKRIGIPPGNLTSENIEKIKVNITLTKLRPGTYITINLPDNFIPLAKAYADCSDITTWIHGGQLKPLSIAGQQYVISDEVDNIRRKQNLIDYRQAARTLGVSRQTVHAMIKRGELHPFAIADRRYLLREEVETLKEKRNQATERQSVA